MERVIVCGITGCGKSTFAQALAKRQEMPYIEMDALFHGPNWQPIPTFVEDVTAFAEQPRWVVDSHGYKAVRDLLWSRADTAVWLDYSRAVVMRRVLSRSARRAWGSEPIFNDNVERFRDWLDPEHPVQWAWTQYAHR
ncbi:MAG: shikimate kinase, partial [Candidatus Nanopelagicales bacterium]